MFKFRPLNRNSESEKNLISDRMRLTLIDVMGEEKGGSYYPDDFFKERLSWHLDQGDKCEILVCENESGEVVGHTIARIENDTEIYHKPFCYFSTVYVTPKWRRQGIARSLISHTHQWGIDQGLERIIYSTAKDHHGLISLLEEFGYKKIIETTEMVRLSKDFL